MNEDVIKAVQEVKKTRVIEPHEMMIKKKTETIKTR